MTKQLDELIFDLAFLAVGQQKQTTFTADMTAVLIAEEVTPGLIWYVMGSSPQVSKHEISDRFLVQEQDLVEPTPGWIGTMVPQRPGVGAAKVNEVMAASIDWF